MKSNGHPLLFLIEKLFPTLHNFRFRIKAFKQLIFPSTLRSSLYFFFYTIKICTCEQCCTFYHKLII